MYVRYSPLHVSLVAGSFQSIALLNQPPYTIDITSCRNIDTLRCIIPIFALGRIGEREPVSRVALMLAPTVPKLCAKLRYIHIVLLFSDHSIDDINSNYMTKLDDALLHFCRDAPRISVKVAACLGRGSEGILNEATLSQWLPAVSALGVLQLGTLEQFEMTKVRPRPRF